MTLYLSGAGAYCAFLLFSKFSDKECSKTDPISWLVVAIASALWVIVIPISLIEIRTKAQKKDQLDQMTKPRNSQTITQRIEVNGQSKEFDSNTLPQLNS
ncbi:MAG: hypothetical protein WBM86_25010 [Waterburya sp.]